MDDGDADIVLEPYLGNKDGDGDDDDGGSLAPKQPPTIVPQVTTLEISSRLPDCPSFQLKLSITAAPGCGGIAWPAGLVRCRDQ